MFNLRNLNPEAGRTFCSLLARTLCPFQATSRCAERPALNQQSGAPCASQAQSSKWQKRRWYQLEWHCSLRCTIHMIVVVSTWSCCVVLRCVLKHLHMLDTVHDVSRILSKQACISHPWRKVQNWQVLVSKVQNCSGYTFEKFKASETGFKFPADIFGSCMRTKRNLWSLRPPDEAVADWRLKAGAFCFSPSITCNIMLMRMGCGMALTSFSSKCLELDRLVSHSWCPRRSNHSPRRKVMDVHHNLSAWEGDFKPWNVLVLWHRNSPRWFIGCDLFINAGPLSYVFFVVVLEHLVNRKCYDYYVCWFVLFVMNPEWLWILLHRTSYCMLLLHVFIHLATAYMLLAMYTVNTGSWWCNVMLRPPPHRTCTYEMRRYNVTWCPERRAMSPRRHGAWNM